MALLYINTGTSPNKGNGDTIRGAFDKVNYNFDLLKSVTSLAGADSIATFTNVVIKGSLDIYSSASFKAKTITLANTSTNILDATGAGLIVFNHATSASMLYNGANDTWVFNKGINAPAVYSNGSPTVSVSDMGDVRFLQSAQHTEAIITSAYPDENISLSPNGVGNVVVTDASLQFQTVGGSKPTNLLLKSSVSNLHDVGLGINNTNDSLRIVGDTTTPGIIVDFGLYNINGSTATWASQVTIDHTGTIASIGSVIAPSIRVDSAIINDRALNISSPYNLTINGATVLPVISAATPLTSNSTGINGQLAYSGKDLYVCFSDANWIKVTGLNGNQWNAVDTLFVGNNALTVNTLTNSLLINGDPALPTISYTVPVSSSSPGVVGQMATTGTNLYVCVALNSWLKFSGVTF